MAAVIPPMDDKMTEVAGQRSQHEVELSGRVVNGEIIFDLPAPLPVGAHTLYAGETKIKLTAGGRVNAKSP